MRHSRGIVDRATTDVTFFVSDPDSQPGMARDSSRRWYSINHFGRKFATHSKYRPCFDTQPAVDLFQCEGLLLAVPHASFKCPGRHIPRVETRIGKFSGSNVLRIRDKIPPLQMCSLTGFNCIINSCNTIHRDTILLWKTTQQRNGE